MPVFGLFRNAQETINVPAGGVVFHEGDEGHEMFGVVEGQVQLQANGRVIAPAPEMLVMTAMGPSTSSVTSFRSSSLSGLIIGLPVALSIAGTGLAERRPPQLLADSHEWWLQSAPALPVGPIDHQRVTADVAGRGGAEERGGPTELTGLAHPTGRHLRPGKAVMAATSSAWGISPGTSPLTRMP